jgi:GNAT superfamily N-acetyltransferase
MIKTRVFDGENKPNDSEKTEIINFLFEHLQEYGDAKKDIQKAIDYAMNEFTSFGGFTISLSENEEILAATVVNKTGMGGYIPENILVYIATHHGHRGKGLGKTLMKTAIDHAEGDIALHVEANNPAKILYEKLGFTNPYLEMRLKK